VDHPELALARRRKGWFCPGCDDVVLTYAEQESAESSRSVPSTALVSAVAALPFPVAFPLVHAGDVQLSASARVDNLIVTAYQAMRVAALVLLADYLSCDTPCADLAPAIRGLRLPHWSEWTTLAAKLVQFWRSKLATKPSGESRAPQLVSGWSRVARVMSDDPPEAVWSPLLDGLLGINQGPALSANDAVQKLRIDRAHRRATQVADAGDDEALEARFRPIVEEAVRELFPQGALELWSRTEENARWRRLDGPHLDWVFPEEGFDANSHGLSIDVCATAVTRRGAIALDPFFAPSTHGEPRRSGETVVEPVLLLDGISERSVTLLGVLTHEDAPSLVAVAHARLASKHVDIGLAFEETTPWTITGWARVSTRESIDRLFGRTYFPKFYMERERLDEIVERQLSTPGTALLLIGDSGSGKSSLLTRLADRRSVDDVPNTSFSRRESKDAARGQLSTERFLLDRAQGDVVLFLSGAADYAGDRSWSGARLLVEAVLRKAGVRQGEFASLQRFASQLGDGTRRDQSSGRVVLLILDGLNESDRYSDLVTALDEFLPCVEKHPWLRLVVSMRAGAYEALGMRRRELLEVGGVFRNVRNFSRHLGENNELRPYLRVRPFRSEPEGRRAYEARQAASDGRACTTVWNELSMELRQLLLTPIHLHLFHEVFGGRSAALREFGEVALFEAYLDHLTREVPGLTGMLSEFGQMMYEHRRASLSRDEAHDWVAAWRRRLGFADATMVTRLDPIEELVASNVLLTPVDRDVPIAVREDSYVFAHERMAEQVLTRALLARIAPRRLPDRVEFVEWASRVEGGEGERAFATLLEVLRAFVRQHVISDSTGALSGIADVPHADTRRALLLEAFVALRQVWGPELRPTSKAERVLSTLLALTDRGVDLAEDVLWATSHASDHFGWRGGAHVAAGLNEALLEIQRAMAFRVPSQIDIKVGLGRALGSLAMWYERDGQPRRALAYYEESLAIRARVCELCPEAIDAALDLARVRAHFGDFLWRLHDSRGVGLIREAVASLRSLVGAEIGGSLIRQQLYRALSLLAGVEYPARRAECVKEALAVARRCYSDASDEPMARVILANALWNYGLACVRPPEREALHREAIEHQRAVADAAPDRSDYREALDSYEAEFAREAEFACEKTAVRPNGRNAQCPCGSGKKAKRCCYTN
jgi:tetratricopeptide (TPR) repeat protein